jgi:hypothetical protein
MGNVWNIQNEQNCDELTGDEIYQRIMYKLNNTRPSEGILVCCSHPKLTNEQEDELTKYKDYIEYKYLEIDSN